ncbi:integrase core domain-containing protein, partial [Aeromonas sp. QDB13]|uniref:integrase core domain-containing protein n=1 Tax=Aeromonas sp. QDB13 TaxID=2990484 RepID=UPI0022E52F7D
SKQESGIKRRSSHFSCVNTVPVNTYDNGSAYRAHETRAFAREIGLEPRTTAVRSPQSNGIAESFVKTMKRDYIEMMPKPDSRTAVGNLAIAFEHYNEHHPHSALGYRSPREFLRSRVSQP